MAMQVVVYCDIYKQRHLSWKFCVYHWAQILLMKRPAHEDYEKVRNQVRRLSRKAVKLKEKDIAMSAKENPKKFWSYIKSKSKTKTSIADLYTDESKTTLTDSDEAKANVLGTSFLRFSL